MSTLTSAAQTSQAHLRRPHKRRCALTSMLTNVGSNLRLSHKTRATVYCSLTEYWFLEKIIKVLNFGKKVGPSLLPYTFDSKGLIYTLKPFVNSVIIKMLQLLCIYVLTSCTCLTHPQSKETVCSQII
jgi:hypothetical protein